MFGRRKKQAPEPVTEIVPVDGQNIQILVTEEESCPLRQTLHPSGRKRVPAGGISFSANANSVLISEIALQITKRSV